ncbi:hypothetical protein LOKG_00065 [Loktanella phage pCB2051-A]|uniref:Uncharacterized protein n=1 Tax=Loktanella phage pCB2051-A TaxID=754044 RepID=M4QP50_9CAUD|nr:hypothetical protein LOKG_00065 [Loktanella phage pCB2051-A]AGH31501.1 hypothetical protein LOKG_00065 [Loktanella phage pCB2051-A]
MNNSTTIAKGQTLSVISNGVEFVLSTNEGDLDVRCVANSPYFSDALDVHQRASNCVTLKPQMKHDPEGPKIPKLTWVEVDDYQFSAVCPFTKLAYEYRHSAPNVTPLRIRYRFNSFIMDGWATFDGDSVEDIKALAQNDYEERIVRLLASA